MIAIVRLIGLALVLASVFLIVLWLGLVAARRAELTQAWEARGHPGNHARFVRMGLARYRARALPRVAALTYGAALVSLVVISYLAVGG